MSEQNPGATVHDLIRLREQLTGWIERLDQVGPQASTRAAERVRADYADRLRRVNEDLSSHRGEIEADLERFRGALAQAEEHRLAAADEMDELSLRHLIGELDEPAWNAARPDLEARVRDAEDAVTAARAEVERLEQLAADISRAESAAAESAAPAAAEAPSAGAEPSALAAPAEGAADEAPAAPTAEQETFGGAFDRDATEDFEPQLPDDFPAAEPEETTFEAPPVAEPETPPAEVPATADAGGGDEWDPFGNEFGAEPKPADAEEDLPWLEGIDQAASAGTGWTPPPAASPADEGLDFLREIEESTRPPATPPASADLGADDLAFLEELDRAIGSGPAASAGRGARTPPPAEPAAPPAQPATAGTQRAEQLLCKECGAINEPHSWYCEICGSEL